MRIAIDISRTAETKTGLGSYARSLVEAMAKVDTQDEFLLYPFVWDCFPPNWKEACCPAAPNFRLARRHVPAWLIRRLWNHSRADRARILGGDPDVYFSPFHSVPKQNFRRLVCVFHDVSFRVHPEFSTEANLLHCEASFAAARACADHFVTVSHYSKQEMVERMGLDPASITVTHEAADPIFRQQGDLAMPDRVVHALRGDGQTILYVGSVEPRKNLVTLVRAFDVLRRHGRCDPTLVIAGGTGWMNSDLHREIGRRGLGDRVVFTGFVTDAELVALYNTCTLFVYPTIYEGFGLPVVEAMSCGIPVVTSRVTSIPEVGGDAVLYVDDPLDVEGLAARMQEALLDQELRGHLRRLGLSRAATFSWARAAQETLAVLHRVHEDQRFLRRTVDIGIDERGLHRGFHGLESEAGRLYRWTERSATLRLAPIPGGELCVEAAGHAPPGEQVLSVRVAGHLVGSVALGPAFTSRRFALPSLLPSNREVEVALDVSFELPPALKGGDPRSLGAKVARVAFEPRGS